MWFFVFKSVKIAIHSHSHVSHSPVEAAPVCVHVRAAAVAVAAVNSAFYTFFSFFNDVNSIIIILFFLRLRRSPRRQSSLVLVAHSFPRHPSAAVHWTCTSIWRICCEIIFFFFNYFPCARNFLCLICMGFQWCLKHTAAVVAHNERKHHDK